MHGNNIDIVSSLSSSPSQTKRRTTLLQCCTFFVSPGSSRSKFFLFSLFFTPYGNELPDGIVVIIAILTSSIFSVSILFIMAIDTIEYLPVGPLYDVCKSIAMNSICPPSRSLCLIVYLRILKRWNDPNELAHASSENKIS